MSPFPTWNEHALTHILCLQSLSLSWLYVFWIPKVTNYINAAVSLTFKSQSTSGLLRGSCFQKAVLKPRKAGWALSRTDTLKGFLPLLLSSLVIVCERPERDVKINVLLISFTWPPTVWVHFCPWKGLGKWCVRGLEVLRRFVFVWD